jgi:hypothetical protein
MMQKYSLLRGGLFVLECARFSFMTGVLTVLNPDTAFPWMVYAVPNALFLLAAMFMWLNSSKYGVFDPLYISGKAMSLFSIIGWNVFSRWAGSAYLNKTRFSYRASAIIFFCDLFSLLAVVLIMVKKRGNIEASQQEEN